MDQRYHGTHASAAHDKCTGLDRERKAIELVGSVSGGQILVVRVVSDKSTARFRKPRLNMRMPMTVQHVRLQHVDMAQ